MRLGPSLVTLATGGPSRRSRWLTTCAARAALGNGTILVSHCDSAQTREVLPTVLREWKAAGIRVTTVSEVLR